MKRLTDQVLARSLLEMRERGISLGLHVRRNLTMYSLVAAYFVVALALLAWLQMWLLFYLVFGMCVGAFLKDFGWVRATRKVFPFTLKVTDWKKVESLAHDSELAEQPSAVDTRYNRS